MPVVEENVTALSNEVGSMKDDGRANQCADSCRNSSDLLAEKLKNKGSKENISKKAIHVCLLVCVFVFSYLLICWGVILSVYRFSITHGNVSDTNERP